MKAYKHIGDTISKLSKQRRVTMKEAVALLRTNRDFKRTLYSGYFLYVDGYFIRNDGKFIESDNNGEMRLTEFALKNIDTGVLHFTEKEVIDNNANDEIIGYFSIDDVNKMKNIANNTNIDSLQYTSEGVNKKVFLQAHAEGKELQKRIADILNSLPNSGAKTLDLHMKNKGISNLKMAKIVNVSTQTISRMRNSNERINQEKTIIDICVALQLPGRLSLDLAEKLGMKFKNSENHSVYFMLLTSHYFDTVIDSKSYLNEKGFKLN